MQTAKRTAIAVHVRKVLEREHRNLALKMSSRWDDFRERKEEAINQYKMVKRRCMSMREMISIFTAVRGIRHLHAYAT